MGALQNMTAFRTFRDPAGSVELKPDGAYRLIRPPFDREILDFLGSPLAASLAASGRLIDSEILPSSSTAAQPLVLRHSRVAFPSYPWEWPPTLWFAAAKLTLALCRDLLQQGWVLKDATPLNVLFRGSRPVFVDLLSIERADPGQSLWLPYAQFIRTFLLPMLAYARLGWPLHATLARRDGYQPEELFAALPFYHRLRQPALSTVTLPHLLYKKSSTAATAAPHSPSDPEVAKHILLRTLATLESHLNRVFPDPSTSEWTNYPESATHYSEEDHAAKHAFVAAALAGARPARVLDVGCNAGVYSTLAANAGAEVVAIDSDLQTVEHLAARLTARCAANPADPARRILPLYVDLARPTPAAGWENRESSSFLDRAAGHFDTILLLAVLHHLLLTSQIPLDRIAALCNSIATRHLILEWIPPTDPMFREILRGRDNLYSHIDEEAFRRAFAPYFTVLKETTLRNGRIILHLVKSKPSSPSSVLQ